MICDCGAPCVLHRWAAERQDLFFQGWLCSACYRVYIVGEQAQRELKRATRQLATVSIMTNSVVLHNCWRQAFNCRAYADLNPYSGRTETFRVEYYLPGQWQTPSGECPTCQRRIHGLTVPMDMEDPHEAT